MGAVPILSSAQVPWSAAGRNPVYRECDTAQSARSEYRHLLRLLGECHLLLDHVDQAIDLIRKARAANPQLWFIHLYLAGALGLRGDLDEARVALSESLRLKPDISSFARLSAAVPANANPDYQKLAEKTVNLGLRRAGFPDE